MPSDISRRDFVNGAALTIAAALTPLDQLMAQGGRSGFYPPVLEGLRGTTDAAFKVMHAVALEGQKHDIDKVEAEESYDLVVVGAGLSGLTAAWAFREQRPKATILILDNNDDFGGHARRTEHNVAGRLILSYGGSETMVAPKAKFKGELERVLKGLRIHPERFEKETVFHRRLYPRLGLSRAVFFDRETFGRDKLVTGDPLMLAYDEYAPDNPNGRSVAAFLADCPLSEAGRRALLELWDGRRDYLSNMSAEQKVERLEKLSYRAFLSDIVKLPADACNLFQGRSLDNWGFGIDALGALDLMGEGYPGAKALKIEDKVGGHEEDKGPYIHHFPDGNAALARALVRSLVKGVSRGIVTSLSMESLPTAEIDYARLDRRNSPVRIRLESTVVHVRNAAGGAGVDVGYVKDGRLHRVKAGQSVIATYAGVMPHICPEIPKDRGELMRSNVKAPLVYTKVAVRSWESFVRLGTYRIAAPMAFHNTVKLDYPVSLGRYKFPSSPKDPAVLHLVHVPGEPGKGLDLRDQARAGRAKLLAMPFDEIEQRVRSDLDRMLGSGGFNAARDIAGITVNRWPHGYSYTPSHLYDDTDGLEAKQAAMKSRIGSIAFANSDTAWDAYAHSAMAEGVRAAGDLTGASMPPLKPRWYQRVLQRFARKNDEAKGEAGGKSGDGRAAEGKDTKR